MLTHSDDPSEILIISRRWMAHNKSIIEPEAIGQKLFCCATKHTEKYRSKGNEIGLDGIGIMLF